MKPQRPPLDALAIASFATARLDGAIRAYWELGDPFAHDGPGARVHSPARPRSRSTRRVALAELAVEASSAIETLALAVCRAYRVAVERNKPLNMLRAVLAHEEVTEEVLPRGTDFLAAFKAVREIRSNYLHGGIVPPDTTRTAKALRQTLELGLRLISACSLLQSVWDDQRRHNIDEALWRFVGESSLVARQAREHFSGRAFDGLRARLQVARSSHGGSFRVDGPFSVAGEIAQSRWSFSGGHSDMLRFPSVHAEIGIVSPPDDVESQDSGRATTHGSLELVTRDLDVRLDGFDATINPLLTPIYLREGDNSPWTYGPGDIRLAQLALTIPYVAETTWYITPEPRLHILSRFKPCQESGTLTGELLFALPGHDGRAAFRGKARLSGRTSAALRGEQLAECTLFASDAGRAPSERSQMWGGVTRFGLLAELDFTLAFSEF